MTAKKPASTGNKQGSAATQFKPGQSGNTAGRKPGISVVTKIRAHIEKAIDDLDKTKTPLEKLIKDEMKKIPVSMLKAIAPFMPKDVNVDIQGNIRMTWKK